MFAISLLIGFSLAKLPHIYLKEDFFCDGNEICEHRASSSDGLNNLKIEQAAAFTQEEPTENPSDTDQEPGPDPSDPDYTLITDCNENIKYTDGRKNSHYGVLDCTFQDMPTTAIYLEGYGLVCRRCSFLNCKESVEKSKGGAAYIKNTGDISIILFVKFDKCKFEHCSAGSGGGLYIHTTKKECEVFINQCDFIENKATYKSDPSEPKGETGGGGLHLQITQGYITSCNFIDNGGLGCNLLVYYAGTSGAQLIQFQNCIFHHIGNSENRSSVYLFDTPSSLTEDHVVFQSCIFDGILDKDTYHIDGRDNKSNVRYIYFYNCSVCTGQEGLFQGDIEKNIATKEFKYSCDSDPSPDPDLPTENPSTTDQEPGPDPSDPDYTLITDCNENIKYTGGRKNSHYGVLDCTFQDMPTTAIYLEGYGLVCRRCSFLNCKESVEKSKGGAAYIKNTGDISIILFVKFDKCKFEHCSAGSGGGLYIHTTKKECEVFINQCDFIENKATYKSDPSEPKGETGGGGLHLQITQGYITSCNFIDNGGLGCNLLVYYAGTSGAQLIQFQNCIFHHIGNSENRSSVYLFDTPSSLTEDHVVFQSCIFDGILDKDTYHIDGRDNKSNVRYIYFYNCSVCTGQEGLFQGDIEKNIATKEFKYSCDSDPSPDPDLPTENPSTTDQEPGPDPSDPDYTLITDCNENIKYTGGRKNSHYGVLDCTFQDMMTTAIYLEGYGLVCRRCSFLNCKESVEKSKGGAAYIKNTGDISIILFVKFDKCKFEHCSAGSGGGLYIHTTKKECEVFINQCDFIENKATYKSDPSEPKGETGGGGLHLQITQGYITSCNFIDNGGLGCNLLVYYAGTSGAQLIQFQNCIFHHIGNSENRSSVYLFDTPSSLTEDHVVFQSCIFDGILDKDTYHIDGRDNKSNVRYIYFYNCSVCTGQEGLFQGDIEKNIATKEFKYSCDSDPSPDPDLPTENQPTIEEPTGNLPTKVPHTEEQPTPDIVTEQPIDYVCESGKRCDFPPGTLSTTTTITIVKSLFEEISNTDDNIDDGNGGAIYLVNYDVICMNNTFTKCTCINHGGAIYIEAALPESVKQINAQISQSNFSKNKAHSGSAIYIKSGHKSRSFSLHGNRFESNEITSSSSSSFSTILEESSSPVGGCVFIDGFGGTISNLVFSGNKGKGADLTILLSHDIEDSASTEIHECNFNFVGNKDSPSSVYVIMNVDGPINLQFINCSFNGTLTEDSHFFEVDKSVNKQGKIFLNDVYLCDFTDISAFGENYTDYIDNNSVIYYTCDNLPTWNPDPNPGGNTEEGLSTGAKVAIGIIVPIVIIAVIIVIVIFVFKKNNTENFENPTSELSETANGSTSDFMSSMNSQDNPMYVGDPLSTNIIDEENDPFKQEIEDSSSSNQLV